MGPSERNQKYRKWFQNQREEIDEVRAAFDSYRDSDDLQSLRAFVGETFRLEDDTMALFKQIIEDKSNNLSNH